jgi:hypothetical protein
MSVDPTTQQAIRGLDFAPSPARSNSQSSDEAKQEDDVSDKLEQSGAVSLSSDASGNKDEVVFTEGEDKAVRRKLDLIVMPILFLGFYVFQVSHHPSLISFDRYRTHAAVPTMLCAYLRPPCSSNEETSRTP